MFDKNFHFTTNGLTLIVSKTQLFKKYSKCDMYFVRSVNSTRLQTNYYLNKLDGSRTNLYQFEFNEIQLLAEKSTVDLFNYLEQNYPIWLNRKFNFSKASQRLFC